MIHPKPRLLPIRSRLAALSPFIAATCTIWALACGGTPAAFGPSYPDNRLAEAQVALARADAAPPRKEPAIAVGAARGALYAYDLQTGAVLWRKALAPTSPPHLAGSIVAVQVGSAIDGFDLRTGERRFAIERGDKALQGADGEGPSSAFTLSRGQGTLAQAEVVLVRDGSVRWRRSIPGQGGAPEVVGSLVLVPWSTQFLSALDLDSGEEIARMRVRDGVISHALRAGSASFVGGVHGLTRLSAALADGSLKRNGVLQMPDRELPGRPPLLPDLHSEPRSPRVDGAEHRIGIAFSPKVVAKGRVGLRDDTLYAFFYRFLYALDPRSGNLRWLRVLDADVVGARAQPQGVLVGDERGRFTFLAAGSGETLWRGQSAVPSTVVRFPDNAMVRRAGGNRPNPNALRAQLVAAIQNADARLAPARVFAVQQLALLQPPEVTADLVALCDSDALTPSVRDRACLELRQRATGSEAVLTALARHAGHLEGNTTPQVGGLATAAASLKLADAVPLLIAHLGDPATRSSDLPALITALGDLGDRSAAPALASFLALYHADPIDPQLVRALQLVPGVLVKLRASAAEPLLRRVATDELGVYSVRQQARTAADALAAPPPAPAEEQPAQAVTESPAAPLAGDVQPSPEAGAEPAVLPQRLTAELVDAALQPALEQLLNCLSQRQPPVVQARVLLVVNEGRAQTVSVIPSELQDCVEPLIRAQTFALTTARTPERLSYTLKR